MSGWRVFVGGAVIALVLALSVLVWVDRAAPVTIVIEAMPAEEMRVSVAGAVASPGVVSVPPGSRLAEVVEVAGGFTEDTDFTGLNLAGRVGDGEQVVIPAIASASTADPGTPPPVASSEAPGILNVNSATAQELEELPGIGEVLASRIIEYREEHGAFSSVDELARVNGISARMIEDLRPLITVDDED